MKNIRAIKNILFLSLITFTAYSFDNNQKIEDILIGMTMKSVCKINSDNFRKREDPCHGYFQYFDDKRIVSSEIIGYECDINHKDLMQTEHPFWFRFVTSEEILKEYPIEQKNTGKDHP